MSEDYLWDRSGAPDPEIERLEQSLAPLRYRHRAELAGKASRGPGYWWAGAAAAILVLAATGLSRLAAPDARATAWQIENVDGKAHLGGREAAVSMPVRAGQMLVTGAESQVTLAAGSVGRIELGPDSELRAATERQVVLRRGLLHAYIWAPPREFVLDTPSARAIDLGCEYTISVNQSGDGLLRVSTGWVAFRSGAEESFIPAGAQCVTRQRQGPGIPFYEDASEPFRRALAGFESGDTDHLAGLLASARPRDGLTLWHLLTRVPAQHRGAVYDRFTQLVTVPPDVSREGILRRDARMIDLCWNALNLENTEWWRGWERRWE